MRYDNNCTGFLFLTLSAFAKDVTLVIKFRIKLWLMKNSFEESSI